MNNKRTAQQVQQMKNIAQGISANDEIETLRQRVREWSDRAMEFSELASRYEEELETLRQQVKELETEADNTNHTMNEYRRELAALKREKQHLINGIGRVPNESAKGRD